MSIQKNMVSWNSYIYSLHLIYLNHWSSITLDLDIPFLLSHDKGAYWRTFLVGYGGSMKTSWWKVFFLDVEILWWNPWRFKGGHFFILMLTCFGTIHKASRAEVFLYFGAIQEESRAKIFLYRWRNTFWWDPRWLERENLSISMA